jgi:hypothetical protein
LLAALAMVKRLNRSALIAEEKQACSDPAAYQIMAPPLYSALGLNIQQSKR